MMALLYVLPPELSLVQIYPRFWALHTLDAEVCLMMKNIVLGSDKRVLIGYFLQAGLPGPDGRIVYPTLLNLSSEKFERHGIYLLENGVEMFLWISRGADPQLIQMLFDKPSYDAVPTGKV